MSRVGEFALSAVISGSQLVDVADVDDVEHLVVVVRWRRSELEALGDDACSRLIHADRGRSSRRVVTPGSTVATRVGT